MDTVHQQHGTSNLCALFLCLSVSLSLCLSVSVSLSLSLSLSLQPGGTPTIAPGVYCTQAGSNQYTVCRWITVLSSPPLTHPSPYTLRHRGATIGVVHCTSSRCYSHTPWGVHRTPPRRETADALSSAHLGPSYKHKLSFLLADKGTHLLHPVPDHLSPNLTMSHFIPHTGPSLIFRRLLNTSQLTLSAQVPPTPHRTSTVFQLVLRSPPPSLP